MSKKSLWRSLLSVLALGIFILLAVGSFDGPDVQTVHLGDGVYQKTILYNDDESTLMSYTGERDSYGRWDGPFKRVITSISGQQDLTEEVNMVRGMRHGKSKITYKDGTVENICYNMGIGIDCEKKAALFNTENSFAFQILSNKYPWFLLTLNTFDYDSAYVEAYLDTLETVLSTYVFEDIEFDDYYAGVISDLGETPYDSIITINFILTFFQGLEEIQNDEFRLAVIDRYRLDGNSTFNIVNTTYPGYLLSVNEAGVNDQDFEGFCQDMDSLMTSYGPLDTEDPFFVDSVDTRMFRAISSILESAESSKSAIRSLKNTSVTSVNKDIGSTWNEVSSMLIPSLSDSSSAVVAEVVFYFMFLQFDQGDIIKRSVREAYFTNKGVISVPTATTEFSGGNSATSVTLNGYVLEDGGAAVSSRGIAWAAFYNPTINDQLETSGTGTGSFTVTLTGLTEGATYYARTYAINSAGTAYGNCIEFTAQSTVGMTENVPFALDLSIYPNPASTFTTFSFQVESSETMVLTIVDLKGQVVYHHDPGSLPQGENQIRLDLSGIPVGIYSCQLTNNGTIKVTRKLVIAR